MLAGTGVESASSIGRPGVGESSRELLRRRSSTHCISWTHWRRPTALACFSVRARDIDMVSGVLQLNDGFGADHSTVHHWLSRRERAPGPAG